MREPTGTTRIVVIVPSRDSAFYVAGEDLIQTPLDHEGYAYVAGPETPHPLDGGRAVDWDRAFSSEAQGEAVRRVDRLLRSLPADATAPGSDPIPLSRRDVSDLLAALATARHSASEVYSAAAEAARGSGQRSAARERERRAARLRESADRLVQSAAAALSAENPLAVLAEAMALVRGRGGKGGGERR